MKQNVIFLMLTLASLNVFAKTPTGDKVDPLIEAKFKKEFGSAVTVSWKIVEGITIGTFTEQGEVKDLFYYEDGEILGRGKIIRRDLLPETVKTSINRRFSPGVIQTVYEFKEISYPTRYFVTVVTPRYSLIVAADEFGQMDVRQKIKSKPFYANVR